MKIYKECSTRQRTILSKFFKECDAEDLGNLSTQCGISSAKVKNLYSQCSERSFQGVAKVWNKRFRIRRTAKIRIAPGVPKLLARVVGQLESV